MSTPSDYRWTFDRREHYAVVHYPTDSNSDSGIPHGFNPLQLDTLVPAERKSFA